MMAVRLKNVAIVTAACAAATGVAFGILGLDADRRVDQVDRCPECRQLAEQVARLQQELGTIKGQPVRESQAADLRAPTTSPPDTRDDQEKASQDRAAAEQHRRDYMLGVAHAFATEKIDPAWASFASSRVSAALEAGNLRNRTSAIECRAQSCRLELSESDASRDSDRASNVLPLLALKLADVLPRISAEHVQRGDGSRTMVLYMSTDAAANAETAKR